MKTLALPFYLLLSLLMASSSFASHQCQDIFIAHTTDEDQVHSIFERLDKMAQKALQENGFKDQDDLHHAIRSSSAFNHEISDLVFSEHFEMAMAVPQDVREAIADSNEFKNQYQTATSKGGVTGEWQLEKQDLEAHLTDTPLETYKDFPAQLKPKYGFGFSRHPRLPHTRSALDNILYYGEDIFVFKKERLAERTSLFIGDSWNEQSGRGAEYLSKSIEGGRTIDQQFLPWDFRDLIVPSVSSYLNYFSTGGQFKQAPDRQMYQEFGEGPGVKRLYRKSMGFISYLELQYWGKLTLDDVKAFYFSKRVPRGPFLKKLKSLGIEIYDFRGEMPVPYNN